MKKIILSFILIVIVAVAGSVYYVFSNLDDLIKEAIETYGSQATQTAVRVESVKMRLTEGAGGISGLTIANPSGFDMPNAFSLGEVRLGIDLQSLQEEPYVIDEVAVIAPEIFVEMTEDKRINLKALTDNLMASLPASDGTAETAPAEPEAAQPRLIVKKIVFTDGRIKAKVAKLGNKEYKLKLPKIIMSDIGGSEGLTPSELASEVISRLSDQVTEFVKKDVVKAELDKIKAEAKAKIAAKKAELDAKVAEQKAKIDAEKAKFEAKKAEIKAMEETEKDALRQKLKDKLNKYKR